MNDKGRMNRSEFIARIAKNKDMSVSDVEKAYNMIIDEIISVVKEGYRLNLMGFGSYYKQLHKGQPVQFKQDDDRMPDYEVFKFSASNTLNQSLRKKGECVVNVVQEE